MTTLTLCLDIAERAGRQTADGAVATVPLTWTADQSDALVNELLDQLQKGLLPSDIPSAAIAEIQMAALQGLTDRLGELRQIGGVK